jgi:hypothetical protein
MLISFSAKQMNLLWLFPIQWLSKTSIIADTSISLIHNSSKQEMFVCDTNKPNSHNYKAFNQSSLSLTFTFLLRIVARFDLLQLLLSVISDLLLLLRRSIFRSLSSINLETVYFWHIIVRYFLRYQIGIDLSNFLSTIMRMLAKEQPK